MTRKTTFREEWSLFKFNNLGLTLGTNLKFYTSVAKKVKTKCQKVSWANSCLCGGYSYKSSPPNLNRVNLNHKVLVILHDIKNYDFHLNMQELKKNVIPNGLNVYMSFTINKKLSLVDS